MNILNEIKIDIPSAIKVQALREMLLKNLDGIGNMYGYVLYTKFKDKDFKGWKLKIYLCDNDLYNTFSMYFLVEHVIDVLIKNVQSNKYVIGYLQPPLNQLAELYKPLVNNLAREAHNHWNKQFEYDDLLQICYLSMTNLYNKGYYIHKQLLRKTFMRDILLLMRKDKSPKEVIKINDWQVANKHDGDEVLSLADTLVDKNEEEQKYYKNIYEGDKEVLTEIKDIIVEMIGERQYDRLLREYNSKSTSHWGRKKMMQIKSRLFALGLSAKSFSKYYE